MKTINKAQAQDRQQPQDKRQTQDIQQLQSKLKMKKGPQAKGSKAQETPERYRDLTLLHSNDMHGDFFAEDQITNVVGGVSLLSGYINSIRQKKKNVLYCIAGDMVQGSLIDTEFKGLSTIDIINLLAPDIAGLGNHETDYGLAHLLFLERCAKFPIVNANIYIANPLTRLFTPHRFVKIDGMRVMFIGIVTAEIVSGIKGDNLVSSLIDIHDAAAEVGRICNAFRTTDVDLTVLLTHIGFEEDCKLAELLDPAWGVDLIIGGHSHTILDQPAEINGIIIAQAGVGTDQIGRFDLIVDMDTNSVAEYCWELVPIDIKHCPIDEKMEQILDVYRTQTDGKYGRILCQFPRRLSHPSRYCETELGNVFADLLRQALGVDLVFYGSGSIRREFAGPVLTLGDLKELCPFSEAIYQLSVTGAQLKRMLAYMLREEAFYGEHTEFFQLSEGIRIRWSRTQQDFEVLELHGEPVDDNYLYTISVQAFHHNNLETSLGVSLDEVAANAEEVILATAEQDVLIEHLSGYQPPVFQVEGRLVVV